MSVVPLSYVDIGLAAVLLFMNAALSLALRLGLARRLLVAGARMVVQLT
ncbi:MAG: ABC transporter permease, partial [Rhodospirillales bacterium]|nr:ABC transporter permease [Rhodospirillales bacterium]